MKNVKVDDVVIDTFTDKMLTIQEISTTKDKKDTYVKGKFVTEKESQTQTRHINDIEELN